MLLIRLALLVVVSNVMACQPRHGKQPTSHVTANPATNNPASTDPATPPNSENNGTGQTSPKSLRFVVRGGELTDEGQRVAAIGGPVVVEVESLTEAPIHQQDLQVRLLLRDEGYINGQMKHAVGLYAERETTLFDQPGKVPFGSARTGAFLHVYVWPDTGDWARVALPNHMTHRRGNKESIENYGGSLLAWVAKSDLTTEQLATPTSDPWVHPTNHSLGIRDVVDGREFTRMTCGPLRIIERRGKHIRLAQLRKGIEVTGWINVVHEPRGQGHARSPRSGCPSRTMLDQPSRSMLDQPSAGVPDRRLRTGLIVDDGGAPLTLGSKVIGWLPPRSSLFYRTKTSWHKTKISWYRIGHVEVRGHVEAKAMRGWRPGEVPVVSSSAAKRQAVRDIPKPVWRTAADPTDAARTFVRRVLRPRARLWSKINERGCRAISFMKTRKRPDPLGGGDPRRIWVTSTKEKYVDSEGSTHVSGFKVIFDDLHASITFWDRFSEVIMVNGGRGASSDGGSFTRTLQVVEVKKAEVVLVRGSGFTRYAEEDSVSLFFDRATCEAGPPPNFVVLP